MSCHLEELSLIIIINQFKNLVNSEIASLQILQERLRRLVFLGKNLDRYILEMYNIKTAIRECAWIYLVMFFL